jgi:beta-lactamase class A
MKTKNRGSIGPRIRYYQHSAGVVYAKRRPNLLAVARGFLAVCIVSAGAFGVYQKLNASPLQRTDGLGSAITQKEQLSEQTNLVQAPKQAREDESMSRFVQSQLKSMPKNQKWSVFIRDLNSERMVSINADDRMQSASLYKLFLLPPLENKLPAKNWNSRLGAHTINDCVTAMIRVSDNLCGEAVGNYVGWQYIDKYNQNVGFTKTKIGSSAQQTTAREVGDLIYRLQNAQILSDKARRLIFDGLYGQKLRMGIPTGCGEECLVGNKTGEDGPVKHDVAVVTHNSAKYVVVIMSENASWSDVASVAHTVDQALLP